MQSPCSLVPIGISATILELNRASNILHANCQAPILLDFQKFYVERALVSFFEAS